MLRRGESRFFEGRDRSNKVGKELSLRRPLDFKKALKEGRRFLSPSFVLYMRKNALSQARFGISISKIHFKLATRRNRLRRIAKEMFKKDLNPCLRGYDLVVASRANAREADFNESIKELKQLMLRLKK